LVESEVAGRIAMILQLDCFKLFYLGEVEEGDFYLVLILNLVAALLLLLEVGASNVS
jgi:hypothetical protein